MTTFRGWAPINERAYDKRPANRGSNISIAGAIKASGFQAFYPYDGAINSERFLEFVENRLLPKMASEDVLIMDNCRIHHSRMVKERLKELSIQTLYLPPYSPELNPIEEAWSAVKEGLRRKKPRTIPDYVEGLVGACGNIDSTKCNGFFRHAAEFGSFR